MRLELVIKVEDYTSHMMHIVLLVRLGVRETVYGQCSKMASNRVKYLFYFIFNFYSLL